MILQERPIVRDGIVRVGTAQRLAEGIWTAREKVSQASEKVEAAEAVRHGRAQANMIGRAADLQQVAAFGSTVGVAHSVMVFPPSRVARMRLPEIHKSQNVDAGACRFVRLQDDVACCRLETQVADAAGTEDGEQGTRDIIVGDKAASPGARVVETRRVESVAREAVAGEGVAQHQGILRIDLMVEFARCFCFHSLDRRKVGRKLASLQSGKGARRQKCVQGRGRRWIDVGADLATIALLFESCVKEGAVFHDGSTHGGPRAIAAEVRGAGRGLEGILSIERGVLDVEVAIAEDEVGAGARHDVDRAARRATVFGRQPVVHNLIFLDVLGRQLGAARAGKFIVVVEPIDRDIVASRAQPPEAEAAVRKARA